MGKTKKGRQITNVTLSRVKNLKKLMAQKNIGRAEMAEKTGISIGTYNALLGRAPRNNLTDSVGKKIEQHFKLSKGWLDEGSQGGDSSVIESSRPPPDKDWISGSVQGVSFENISPQKGYNLLDVLLAPIQSAS